MNDATRKRLWRGRSRWWKIGVVTGLVITAMVLLLATTGRLTLLQVSFGIAAFNGLIWAWLAALRYLWERNFFFGRSK